MEFSKLLGLNYGKNFFLRVRFRVQFSNRISAISTEILRAFPSIPADKWTLCIATSLAEIVSQDAVMTYKISDKIPHHHYKRTIDYRCLGKQPLFTFGCCILLRIYPTCSLWCRQSQQSFNTLTPFYFPSHSLHVSATTGHLQVRYTIRYFKDFF
jgi:hypothetical protein